MDGNVPNCVFVRVHRRVAESPPLSLLESEVHSNKERPPNEGDIIDDEKFDVGPSVFNASECAALQLTLPCGLGKHLKPEQAVFTPKPMLKAAAPV